MGLDVGEIGMGLDLGLDLRLFAARTAGGMAAAAAKGAPAGIESCIRSLEEERKKIEVFRRELPLCARLLADGENYDASLSLSSFSCLSLVQYMCRGLLCCFFFSAPVSLTRWFVRPGLQ